MRLPFAFPLNLKFDFLFASADESPEYQQWRQTFLQKRLGLAIQIALLAYLTFIALRFAMVLLGGTNDPSWFSKSGASVLALLIIRGLYKTSVGQRHLEWLLLGCSWSITLIEQVWATLQGFAFPGVFAWTLAFLTQATLIPVRWQVHLVTQAVVLIYYLAVSAIARLPLEPRSVWDATLWLYLFWFCVICDLSVYLYERLQKQAFQARLELEAEREKSEKLLLNILPQPIVKQLKQEKTSTIAEHFPEVSVLFADIVDFTRLSAGIPPQEMVTLLNEIFSSFDHLAGQHGLEKIKTIGDAYMVVGGVPVERPDHLEAIADMALDMQAALTQFNSRGFPPFQMRIGINTGPVVAGVIGVKKFIYDLWGDTVNTASRMESHGIPGHIQVTEAVYVRLKDKYLFEERGAIGIKGKGEMQVYLLKQKLQPLKLL